MRMAGPLLPTWLEFDRSTFNKPNGDSFFCYGLRPITYLHVRRAPIILFIHMWILLLFVLR
jgi:hypothetical protein